MVEPQRSAVAGGAGCPTAAGTDRYQHCTNGKDRTGWAVALVLLAVGVDVDDVMTDYLTTNEQLLPVMEGLFASVREQGIDPSPLLPVMGSTRTTATALNGWRAGWPDAYLDLAGHR